jgi:hypothetical protein
MPKDRPKEAMDLDRRPEKPAMKRILIIDLLPQNK